MTVCLSVCRLVHKLLKKLWILDFWDVDFGGDPDRDRDRGFLYLDDDPDTGLFKGFYIHYCAAYRQTTAEV